MPDIVKYTLWLKKPEAAAAFILRPFLRILKLLQTRKDTYTSKSTEIHFVQHGLLARACNNTF